MVQNLSPFSIVWPFRRPFLAALAAFAIAQILKLFTYWYSERRWDWTRIIGSGGMPSSHTGLVRFKQCHAHVILWLSCSISHCVVFGVNQWAMRRGNGVIGKPEVLCLTRYTYCIGIT